MSLDWTSRVWTPRGPWEIPLRPLGLRLSGPGSKLKLQTRLEALRTSRSYLREAHWRNCKGLHPHWPLGFVHTRIYGVSKASPLAVISTRMWLLKTIHTWVEICHGRYVLQEGFLNVYLILRGCWQECVWRASGRSSTGLLWPPAKEENTQRHTRTDFTHIYNDRTW